jgi:Transposase
VSSSRTSILHVPGRKTDMTDSPRLAVLARFGLLRTSFIPSKDLRELRLVSLYRRKLTQMHSAEVSRLHKVLGDGCIKIGGVVSDINGVSASAMALGLIEGQDIASLLGLARGALSSSSATTCKPHWMAISAQDTSSSSGPSMPTPCRCNASWPRLTLAGWLP